MSLNRKFAVGAVLIAAGTLYLAYLGAASSWRYYVLVDECVEHSTEFVGHRLRVNGKVAAESLVIRDDRQLATFTLCGATERLQVTCPGPLPDNLAEEIDVVVEGRLESGTALRLAGDRVLTRCASKYAAQADSEER